jgi:hypothetical protein
VSVCQEESDNPVDTRHFAAVQVSQFNVSVQMQMRPDAPANRVALLQQPLTEARATGTGFATHALTPSVVFCGNCDLTGGLHGAR